MVYVTLLVGTALFLFNTGLNLLFYSMSPGRFKVSIKITVFFEVIVYYFIKKSF